MQFVKQRDENGCLYRLRYGQKQRKSKPLILRYTYEERSYLALMCCQCSPPSLHQKPLKVRQNASKRMPSLRPAAPVLMRLRPWRTFESKDPYIAGRCGGGTTARAGPKWAFFLLRRQHHSQGREKAASWAACAVAGTLWRG